MVVPAVRNSGIVVVGRPGVPSLASFLCATDEAPAVRSPVCKTDDFSAQSRHSLFSNILSPVASSRQTACANLPVQSFILSSTMRPSTVLTIRIAFACIGVAVGFFTGLCFAGHFMNFNAASWAFTSGVFASIVLILHIKYKRLTLRAWFPNLRCLMLVGCFGQLAGFSAMVTYIALAIVLRQGLDKIYGENFWVALVWGWMTWKWAFALFYYARFYRRQYLTEMTPKVPDDVNDEEDARTDSVT